MTGPYETEQQVRELPVVRAVYDAFERDPGAGKMTRTADEAQAASYDSVLRRLGGRGRDARRVRQRTRRGGHPRAWPERPVGRRKLQAPGAVEVRLSGAAEDIGILISVLGRIAAGLPVTTVRLEILHRSGDRANRRDPGERTYVLVQVTAAGTGASGSGSAP